MAKKNEEENDNLKVDIQWEGNHVHVKTEDGLIDWEADMEEEAPIYNVPTWIPISLEDPTKVGLNEMDHLDLYKAWQKINQLIRGAKNRRQKDIHVLRNLCQTWLDDVRYREHVPTRGFRWDQFKYWIRGKYKQRKDFLYLFGLISWEMCAGLDEIDGGPDQEQEVQHSYIGFNHR